MRIAGVLAGCLLASSLLHAATIPSETVQGGLVVGKVDPGSKITFLEREVFVADDGVFVVGIGRNQKTNPVLSVRSPKGLAFNILLDVAQREYDIQRIDGLPPKKVTADKSQDDRIYLEWLAIRNARKTDSPLKGFINDWQWPVTGRISGVYGSQRVLNGKPKTPHSGVDVAAPKGTPVGSPAAGVVTLTNKDMYYSGGTVLIDHGHGVNTSYSHLSKIDVKVGDVLAQGDKLGEIGMTGRATGPHLHWRVNWYDVTLDPALLVPAMPSAE
jgi:murein DD-endopeptidase MepM/ murein hydrolase activator NlpD